MAITRTCLLAILDGLGINNSSHHNAVIQAKTPVLDRLMAEYPNCRLDASEHHVGLPAGFMGNSEVGHLNIGAGRIVHQDFSVISQAVEQGSFFENPAFCEVISRIKGEPRAVLHLMGLLSDGGVHSHTNHLLALLRLAKKEGIRKVCIHAILDGRDTPPTNGYGYIRKLKAFCEDIGLGEISSVMGRFYAMDRDNRWERIEQAYKSIVVGEANYRFSTAAAYVQQSYERQITDEFVLPSVAKAYGGLKDGDGVIFFNFRADRARQITQAMTQMEFSHFRRKNLPALTGFVCMTPYNDSFDLPCAYSKAKILNTLGEVVSRKGGRQLRIAETEKYAHVTYFFSGGREDIFEQEERILVPSDRGVSTYDEKPEMGAWEITEKLLSALRGQQYQLVVVNFANPDMVGHTGNFPAAVAAVETVDACLGKLVNWIENQDAYAVVMADHGNCEMMQDSTGLPMTAHTMNQVPFIWVDAKRKRNVTLREDGRLCDIAPTILDIWDVDLPSEMTGKSLVKTATR